MHLTRTLHFFKRYKKVPGLLFEGKNKIIPKIQPWHKKTALKWYMIQENNDKILQRPYLTEAEDNGHMEALGYSKEAKEKALMRQAYIDRWNKPMKKRIHHLEESLKHLNIKKSWE